MKKTLSLILVTILVAALVAGCGSSTAPSSSQAAPSGDTTGVVPVTPASSSSTSKSGITINIAGLKGPTTMGMVKLMQDADEGLPQHEYNVTMYGSPDEIAPKLIQGDIDIAAVPANLASVLYARTDGAVDVAAINTLGVLYVLEAGDTVQSVEDLRGQTIYSTGKGTTPEYVLNYILQENGIDPATDVTIEYLSESTEVAAHLATEEGAIAVLPQPYATAVQAQNENVRQALNLTEEWDSIDGEGSLVTGVLVVRKAFAEENLGIFSDFLSDYAASIRYVGEHPAEAAQLISQYGIVESPEIAERALPACNITYVDGAAMKTMLQGYLQVLFDQDPEAVGGAMPGDDFYFAA